jgi:glycosyltransferase involved in cell wall biosynthesis
MRLRLLYVVHQFLPQHVTGTEQYVRSMARGMQALGHEVTVLSYEPVLPLVDPERTYIEEDEIVDGIPVRRVGLHLDILPNVALADYHNPMGSRFLCRLLDERTFDLAHVFHLRFLGVGVLDELRRAGLPVVVNLMDFWYICANFTLMRPDGALCDGPPQQGVGCIRCVEPWLADEIADRGIEAQVASLDPDLPRPLDHRTGSARRARAYVGRKDHLLAALAKADAVVAPSRFLRSKYEENGFPTGVIRHLPYGVDPDRLGGRRKEWPEEWPAEPRRPVQIGYVGSIAPHKGLHILISAARSLARDDWHLHVHGPPDTHPDYTRWLRELAGDDLRITFHGAFAAADLGDVLASLDVVVVPSLWYENTPFAILEARVMGLPVVASDLGGIGESIADGQDGLLFPAGDAGALAAVLGGILDDPARLPTLGRPGGSGRTLSDNVADFIALYDKLLSERARAR